MDHFNFEVERWVILCVYMYMFIHSRYEAKLLNHEMQATVAHYYFEVKPRVILTHYPTLYVHTSNGLPDPRQNHYTMKVKVAHFEVKLKFMLAHYPKVWTSLLQKL